MEFKVHNAISMVLFTEDATRHCTILMQKVDGATTELIPSGKTAELTFFLDTIPGGKIEYHPGITPHTYRYGTLYYWTASSQWWKWGNCMFALPGYPDLYASDFPGCKLDFYFTEPDAASPKGMVTLKSVILDEDYANIAKNPDYQHSHLQCTREDDHTIKISDSSETVPAPPGA